MEGSSEFDNDASFDLPDDPEHLSDMLPAGFDDMTDLGIFPSETAESVEPPFGPESPFELNGLEKAMLNAYEIPDGEQIARDIIFTPPLPSEARVVVDMNHNTATAVAPDQHVTMLTGYLNGCTATAVSAQMVDGSCLMFMSHMGLLSDQEAADANGNQLSASLLSKFRSLLEERGDVVAVQVAVAHAEDEIFDESYGQRKGPPATWHLLDQLRHSTEEWQEQSAAPVTAVFLPYPTDYAEHAVAVDVKDGQTAFYYDGILIPGFAGDQYE